MTKSDDQDKSFAYWEDAQTTYLASPDYYDKQEINLRNILKNYGPFLRGLDVGCGDGRYTFVASEHTQKMVGIDIGPYLLDQAKNRKQALEKGANINFLAQSVTSLTYSNEFDLIMCLGVTSALITPKNFQRTITGIAAASTIGSLLITKDTLATKQTYISTQGDYIACYRNQELYLNTIEASGYELLETQELITANDLTVNVICVFRKAK